MRILYFDCGMGAAGDMISAALLELIPNAEGFIDKANKIGIPKVAIKAESSEKCGIKGTHLSVRVDGIVEGEEHGHCHNQGHCHGHTHDHEHPHDHNHNHAHGNCCHAHEHDACHEHDHEHSHERRGMHEIEHIIEALDVSDRVKSDASAVYKLIAEAESHAHGVPVNEIHFHEVGTMDAIADIVIACMLIEQISPDRIVASPIHVGSGNVKCAHGILPVPAPATVYILKDVPIYGGSIKSELCTPTGAALLKHFVANFGDMPVMRTTAVGYGMGKKDFEAANCVRAWLGETFGEIQNNNNNDNDNTDNNNSATGIEAGTDVATAAGTGTGTDTVAEISCNVDDMTPEAVGFAMDKIMAEGALDVYTIPIGMKKSRPGIMLCALCKESDKEKIVKLLFKHTTTLGIRENISRRYVLDRRTETISTEFGNVRKKISCGYDVTREKYEYEDVVKIAEANELSIDEAVKIIDTQDSR